MHSDTKIHEDAQKSSVLLCGFVSLWLVVTVCLDSHTLLALDGFEEGGVITTRLLRRLTDIPSGQRYHAHPFLGPGHRWLYFTEVIDSFSQVCALDTER